MNEPQLQMRHVLEVLPPVRPLPEGYNLRIAIREDSDAISVVLTDAFGEPWDAQKVHRELFDDPNVPITFVVERMGNVVATASYQTKPQTDPEDAWLHWVGVHSNERGKALGALVTREVLLEAVRRGRRSVYLTTDDFRLAAINVYVKLGFVPDSWHESHAMRWESIFKHMTNV